MTYPDLMLKNREKLIAHGREFKQTFNVALVEYLHPQTGFDLIRFDAVVRHFRELFYYEILY